MARYLNTTRGQTLDRGDGRFSSFGEEIDVDGELNDTMRDHLNAGRIVQLPDTPRPRPRTPATVEEA